MLGHSGGGYGFLCDIYWLPEYGLGVTVLTNSTAHSLQGKLAFEILDVFKKPKRRKRQGTTRSGKNIPERPRSIRVRNAQALVGHYFGRFDSLHVKIRKGQLGIKTQTSFLPLVFVRKNEALAKVGQPNTPTGPRYERYRFVFVKSAQHPDFVVRVRDGTTWSYNDGPTDPSGPDDAAWSPYIGAYRVKVHGKSLENVQIDCKNGYLYYGSLKCEEFTRGLFFSTTGEALKFGDSGVTYANIPLDRSAPPSISRRPHR